MPLFRNDYDLSNEKEDDWFYTCQKKKKIVQKVAIACLLVYHAFDMNKIILNN